MSILKPKPKQKTKINNSDNFYRNQNELLLQQIKQNSCPNVWNQLEKQNISLLSNSNKKLSHLELSSNFNRKKRDNPIRIKQTLNQNQNLNSNASELQSQSHSQQNQNCQYYCQRPKLSKFDPIEASSIKSKTISQNVSINESSSDSRLRLKSQKLSKFNNSKNLYQNSNPVSEFQQYQAINIQQQINYKILTQNEDEYENDLIKLISSRPRQFQQQTDVVQLQEMLQIQIDQNIRQFIRIIHEILQPQNVCMKNGKSILFQNGTQLLEIIKFCKQKQIQEQSQAILYLSNINNNNFGLKNNNQDKQLHWSLFEDKYKFTTFKQLVFLITLFQNQLCKKQPISISQSKRQTFSLQYNETFDVLTDYKEFDSQINKMLKQHTNCLKCSKLQNQSLPIQKQWHKNKFSIMQQFLSQKNLLLYKIYIWSVYQCRKQEFTNLNSSLLLMQVQMKPTYNKISKFMRINKNNHQQFLNKFKKNVLTNPNQDQEARQTYNNNKLFFIQKKQKQDYEHDHYIQIKTIRNCMSNAVFKKQLTGRHQVVQQGKTCRLRYQQKKCVENDQALRRSFSNSNNSCMNFSDFYEVFCQISGLNQKQITLLYKYFICITDKKTYKITDTNKLISVKIIQKFISIILNSNYQDQSSHIHALQKQRKKQQQNQNQIQRVQIKMNSENFSQFSTSQLQKKYKNIGLLLKKQKNNKHYINQLKSNKQKLLQIIELKQKQILKMKKINILNQVEFQNQKRTLIQIKDSQKSQLKRRFETKINQMNYHSKLQDKMTQFYREQLQNLMQQINGKSQLQNRYLNNKKKFDKADKFYNGDQNIVARKIAAIKKRIQDQKSVLQQSEIQVSSSEFQKQFDEE